MHTVIENITQLAQTNEDIVLLWLYGSQAKGTNQADSDYDLAVAFKNFPKTQADTLHRKQTLALEWQTTLKLNDNIISLIDINQCPLYLAINVINDSKLLINKNTSRLMKEEARILALFEHDIFTPSYIQLKSEKKRD